MKTLVILAHPDLTNSRANKTFMEVFNQDEEFVVHNLYELYPNFAIDADKERELLLAHNTIVLQFPFYWYNMPPLLKKWFDDVFVEGFAYGKGGNKLAKKQMFVSLSDGGAPESYTDFGYAKYTLTELLRPLEATANLCQMDFITVHSISNVSNRTDLEIVESAKEFIEKVKKVKRLSN
ncbi:MAG: NAD(P)H-dependent oxidoreductase [Bacilli bacterium]|nr:NAD(P)H-dependent oxidoreductase [Bacilli bacterium]